MLALAQSRPRPVAVTSPERCLSNADPVLAMLAAATTLAELRQKPVDGRGVHPAESQLPKRRDNLVLDQAAIAEHRPFGDGALAGSPLAPGVQQLGDGLVASGPVLPDSRLLDQPCFKLPSLGPGPGHAGLLPLLADK